MRLCSTRSVSHRCSISSCASVKEAAPRSRCRSSAARSRFSPTWPRSTPPASPMRVARGRLRVSFDTRFILRRPLWAVAAAVGFLTRLPLGRRLELDAGDVARGALFFPLVGAGIGAAGGGIALLAHHRLSALLAAVLSVAVVVVLTGALHVDALADLADACGGATRKRRLEIM